MSRYKTGCSMCGGDGFVWYLLPSANQPASGVKKYEKYVCVCAQPRLKQTH
jgi:hypothetical protein